MGSVHDEEPDCCLSTHCCCNQCADNFLFANVCSMRLRKSGTTRIAVGAILGLALGLIIQSMSPKTPVTNKCMTNTGQVYTPSGDYGCNSYFQMDAVAEKAFHDVRVRREFALCVGSGGRNSIAPTNGNCGTTQPTLIFDTYTGKEVRFCLGTKNVNGSVMRVGTLNDMSDCSIFKKTFTDTDWTTWQAYVGNVASADTDISSGIEYCLNISTSSLTKIPKNTMCPSGVRLETLKETVAGSTLIMETYTSDVMTYNLVIQYLFNLLGRIWLRCLSLIVMPLLAANIITSVAQLRETSASGSVKLAWMTALYYVLTTICAAIESLVLVNIMIMPFLKPIEDASLSSFTKPTKTYINTGAQIKSVFTAIVPSNIAKETMNGGYLSIIFFSIVIGSVVGLESKFLKFFQDLNTMMLRLVRLLVLWTPLGVFLLVTYAFAYHHFFKILNNVGLFLLTVFVGLFLHLFCVYPLIYFVATRKNPYVLLKNIVPAMLTALSISSSIATYPYTLDCAVKKNKFNMDISKFVLTLGATVNMDGTTIGFPIAVMFVAKAQGIDLEFGQQLLIVILSTVSSMGAAPVPQAGLVLLIVIIESLGIPLGSVFTLIVAVDWLYDRPETMVNICGDSFAAGIMDHFLHKEFEQGKNKGDNDFGKEEGISS